MAYSYYLVYVFVCDYGLFLWIGIINDPLKTHGQTKSIQKLQNLNKNKSPKQKKGF